MVGAELSGEQRLTAPAAAIQGVADFDADGRADVLWRDRSGVLTLWLGADPERTIDIGPGGTVVVGGDPAWSIAAVRDFNRDGRADILWQEETGRLVVWILAGGRIVREEYPRLPLRTWTLANRLAAVEEAGAGGSDAPPAARRRATGGLLQALRVARLRGAARAPPRASTCAHGSVPHAGFGMGIGRAIRTISSARRVLPMPAGPLCSAIDSVPAAAPSSRRASCARSVSRPTNGTVGCGPGCTVRVASARRLYRGRAAAWHGRVTPMW